MLPVYPPDNATQIEHSPILTADVQGVEGSVRLEGRVAASPGTEFTVIALPDTQHYACGCNGGETTTFGLQTQWIAQYAATADLRFVTQLGDCVQNADILAEWQLADAAMSVVEELGIPYGITVGNHDQYPTGDTAGTSLYNATFGIARFEKFAWYAGHYGSDNDNHVETFEAGNVGWVVIHLEYDDGVDSAVLAWLGEVLDTHADRRAIVVTHNLVDTFGTFSPQGAAIYDVVRTRENVAIMLGGHVLGEGRRTNTIGAHSVHSLLSDYQGRTGGGDGWLRILRFSPATNQIAVSTYSPTLDSYEVDEDSSFILNADLSSAVWPAIGTGNSVEWPDLLANTTYEWRAVVETAEGPHWGPTWQFTTGADESRVDSADSGDKSDAAADSGANLATGPVEISGGCQCQAGERSGPGGLGFACIIAILGRYRRAITSQTGGKTMNSVVDASTSAKSRIN